MALMWYQTAANDCLGLSCGMRLLVPLTGHTLLLSMSSMVALTCLRLPTHPHHPPTPLYMPSVILVAVKKVAQNPVVLAS